MSEGLRGRGHILRLWLAGGGFVCRGWLLAAQNLRLR
ncbi:hypothetical protein ACVWY6_002243 [Williamsia sp. R60]